mgnify:CR=1 FL=1
MGCPAVESRDRGERGSRRRSHMAVGVMVMRPAGRDLGLEVDMACTCTGPWGHWGPEGGGGRR